MFIDLLLYFGVEALYSNVFIVAKREAFVCCDGAT